MIQGERALELARLPLSELARQSPAWLDGVLGGICFGALDASSQTHDMCIPSVAIPPLTDDEGHCELWRTTEPLVRGAQGPIRFCRARSLLFGYLSAAEEELTLHCGPDISGPPLQQAAEVAYRKIFECLDALGFPTLVRFWSYFPKINRVSHGIERYRQFNIGRQNAFLAGGRKVVDAVPPACALGCPAETPLSIAFLATNREVISIGNPRQVDAFHYPQRYGPRSPTFSRAGLLALDGQKSLFVSGTSSIVGHKTLHRGDAAAQTRETLSNIEAVLVAANESVGVDSFRMDELRYNAYVRHADDLQIIQSQIESRIGADTQVAYLQADICRADLLVEIEAFGV